MPPTPSTKAPAPITATPAPFTLAVATVAAAAATAVAAAAAVATKPDIQVSKRCSKVWPISYKLRATSSDCFLFGFFLYSGMDVIDLFFRFKMAFDMSYFVWKEAKEVCSCCPCCSFNHLSIYGWNYLISFARNGKTGRLRLLVSCKIDRKRWSLVHSCDPYETQIQMQSMFTRPTQTKGKWDT